jgi:two-component system heavy metal sensor histidine kinase CusS
MEGQLIAFPGIMLAVYLVSRALLSFAMKPIADVFTFQETFSSNVSHELRSPLASLQGNFEVALRRPREADEYREALTVGLKETGRIITLLNNLTLLASSKFRPLELLKRPVDIKPLIDSAAAAMRHDAAAYADISVTVEVEGTELLCNCDEILVRRVIENLVSNAVKYAARPGCIHLKAALGSEGVIFRITNTCAELTDDDMLHVFDPFFRGGNAPESGAQGHGIGLYVSRHIIASHGGEMRAEMGADGSFSVWFSIPA